MEKRSRLLEAKSGGEMPRHEHNFGNQDPYQETNKETRNMISPKTTLTILHLPVIVLTLMFGFSQTGFAKEQECCWIDVKTGKQVPTVPSSGINHVRSIEEIRGATKNFDPGIALVRDGKTAFNTLTKQNYAKEPDGCWIDVKTGKRVPTVPSSGINHVRSIEEIRGATKNFDPGIALVRDGKTAFNTLTKQNYALVPCPPPGETAGDTIKKVLEHVNIGIGIGGGHTSGHDHDRGRRSGSSTHKTVTSGCKCHPCTCAPTCTCH